MNSSPSEDVRLDVWLWRARFFKTRALASSHICSKGIRLTRHGATRKVDKPGTRLQPGDTLTFMRGNSLLNIEFVSPGERRGPAGEAQALYRVASESEN